MIKYTEALDEAVVESAVSHETMNYLLKNQIVSAAIINHNLKRIISFLVWKLQMERATASIKGEMGKALRSTVDALEGFLTKSNSKYQIWKKRVEKLDYEIEQLKQRPPTQDPQRGFVPSHLPIHVGKLLKPIRKVSYLRLNALGGLFPAAAEVKRKYSCQVLNVGRLVEEQRHAQEIAEQEEEIKDNDTEKSDDRDSCEKDTSDNNTANGMKNKIVKRPIDILNENMKDTILPQMDSGAKQREEIEQLEADLKEAHNELSWHKTLSDLLMEEIGKTREQATTLQKQMAEMKATSERLIESENRNWQLITKSLKENFDKELARRQNDIAAMHEQLAEWIIKYMELEKTKGNSGDSKSVQEMLKRYQTGRYLLGRLMEQAPQTAKKIVGDKAAM